MGKGKSHDLMIGAFSHIESKRRRHGNGGDRALGRPGWVSRRVTIIGE